MRVSRRDEGDHSPDQWESPCTGKEATKPYRMKGVPWIYPGSRPVTGVHEQEIGGPVPVVCNKPLLQLLFMSGKDVVGREPVVQRIADSNGFMIENVAHEHGPSESWGLCDSV